MKTGDLVEGRYRIIKTLGAGGMGTVFLAEHALIRRRVAVKILHPELATDADVIERFMNEARAAGTLGDPNIVESTDMGFAHGHVPYIVYEYLEGTLLTDEIYRVGGLPVRRTLRIAGQIASALHAAHSASIIHRDLKSDNVFLTDRDEQLDHVKVLDFGVSRFLEAEERQRGLVVGTPEFMAPEQITDPDGVDTRADIYALGVILYEMLTARRPFQNNDDPRRLMHRIVNDPPPPLMRAEVPQLLAQMIVERMLAKEPSERFQSMGEVQVALEPFVTRDGAHSLSLATPGLDDDDRATTAMPALARSSPWPVDTLDGATPYAIGQVTMPPPAKRPYAVYGIASAGIVMGAVGLVVGLRGRETPAPSPPIIVQAPPPVLPAAAPAPSPAPEAPEPQKISVELDADAPNARVVFRRRVAAAPVSMTINATEVVEMVEVSAPGYRTTRYWLTFDRPTRLRAHLEKGTGSIEATEEDTLVALGEVILVTGTAPKGAVEKPARAVQPEPAKTPRKIGKGAASDELAAALTEPTRRSEPSKSPRPVPVVAAKPEVARPRALLDRATISAVVTAHRPEVLRCLADGKKKNRSMKGTLTLLLQVDATGSVRSTRVHSTLDAPAVTACVVKSATVWRFPARAGGEVATVSYPFTIN